MRCINIRYIRFTYSNGYCCGDDEEYVAFKDDPTDEYLNEYAQDLALDHAEQYEGDPSFGFPDPEDYADGVDDVDFMDDYDEALEEYEENIEADWETVTREDWKGNNGYVE